MILTWDLMEKTGYNVDTMGILMIWINLITTSRCDVVRNDGFLTDLCLLFFSAQYIMISPFIASHVEGASSHGLVVSLHPLMPLCQELSNVFFPLKQSYIHWVIMIFLVKVTPKNGIYTICRHTQMRFCAVP